GDSSRNNSETDNATRTEDDMRKPPGRPRDRGRAIFPWSRSPFQPPPLSVAGHRLRNAWGQRGPAMKHPNPLVAALALLLLTGRPGSTEPAPTGPASATPSAQWADAPLHGVQPLPQGRWTELAQQLVAADDLATATRLTREILARGGMPTTDGKRIVVPAIGPATPYQITALEARNLAME